MNKPHADKDEQQVELKADQQEVEHFAEEEMPSDARSTDAETTVTQPVASKAVATKAVDTEPVALKRSRRADRMLLGSALILAVSVAVLNQWIGPVPDLETCPANFSFSKQEVPTLLLQYKLRLAKAQLFGDKEAQFSCLIDIAQLHLINHDFRAAEETLVKARQFETYRRSATNTLFQLYVSQKQWDKAAELVDNWLTKQKLKEMHEGNVHLMSIVYENAGRKADAEKMRHEWNSRPTLQRLAPYIGTFPNGTPASKAVENETFPQLLNASRRLLAIGNYADARQYLEFMISRNPEDPHFQGKPRGLHAFHLARCAEILMPVASMKLHEDTRAEREFAIALKSREQLGSLCDPMLEGLLYQNYAEFLRRHQQLKSAALYDEKAKALFEKTFAPPASPWWKKS